MSESGTQGPSQLGCPGCGGAVLAELADQPQIANCPHCGQPLMLPGRDGSMAALAQLGQGAGDWGLAQEQLPAEDDDELDGLRIRRVAAARRAAYRSRGYYLMGAAILLAAGGQLVLVAGLIFKRQGWQWGLVWRGGVGAAFVAGAIFIYRRARRLMQGIGEK